MTSIRMRGEQNHAYIQLRQDEGHIGNYVFGACS
jgi:hypothetical protein